MEDHGDDMSVGRDEVAEEEEGKEGDAAEGEGEHHRGRYRGTGKEEGENATNEVADRETEKTTSWDKEDLLPSSSIVDGSTNWIRSSPFMSESRKLESSPWSLVNPWVFLVIVDITAATMVVMRKNV